MSFKSIQSPSNVKVDIKNRLTAKKLLQSYVSLREIKNHPEISSAIKSDKKMSFGLLSNVKPKLTDIKGINNINKQKLVNRINTFRKIFFDNCRNSDSSMNEIRILRKENNDFTNNYKKVKELNGDNKKQFFADIKEAYEKKNYYVPPLVGNKKNLFNGNILLANNNDLQDFILYDFGTTKSNNKSIFFLEKIQNEIINRNLNEGKKYFLSGKKLSKNQLDCFDKIEKDNIMDIKNSKSEIKKTKITIDLMGDIDFFFNSDGRQYFNRLKKDISRESSARISTRVSSAIGLFENIKFMNNLYRQNNKFSPRNQIISNNSTNSNNNITNIENSNINIINLYNENTNITSNMNNITESTISPLKNEISRLNLSDIKSIEQLSARNKENNNSKISEEKKIKLTKKSKISNSFKVKNKEKTKKSSLKANKINKESIKDTLEKLYEKTEKSNYKNKIKINNHIKNYFKLKNVNVSSDEKKEMIHYSISHNIDNVRQKLSNNNCFKNDYYLRRMGGNSLDKITRLNKKNEKLRQYMNKIEDKMIKMYCELKNPKIINL